jgi:hypothetical protein
MVNSRKLTEDLLHDALVGGSRLLGLVFERDDLGPRLQWSHDPENPVVP